MQRRLVVYVHVALIGCSGGYGGRTRSTRGATWLPAWWLPPRCGLPASWLPRCNRVKGTSPLCLPRGLLPTLRGAPTRHIVRTCCSIRSELKNDRTGLSTSCLRWFFFLASKDWRWRGRVCWWRSVGPVCWCPNRSNSSNNCLPKSVLPPDKSEKPVEYP